MATYYWTGAVNGGTGTWDTTTKTNWSTTSGGAGGSGPPGTLDVATFDANSGSGVCSLGANILANRLPMTGYTGTLDFVTYKISLSGANTSLMSVPATTTIAGTSPTVDATYSGAVGTRTISFSNTNEAQSINVNVTAGTDIVSTSGWFKDINFSGFTGSWGSNTRIIYGSLTMNSGMTVTASTLNTTFSSTNASARNITSNGVTLDSPVVFNGVAGSWALQDNFTIGSTRALTLTNGTLNANNKNVSIGTFALGSGTKTLTLGSGTWTVQGASWNANTNVANLTVSASTGTIKMTSASSKTFSGGAKTWPVLDQGNTGALVIAQSNTFTDITSSYTATGAATITFTAGTTQTVTQFTASGTSGKQLTLNSSTPGSAFTLSDASGTVSVSYCSISDSTATGGAAWNSYTTNGNVDDGGNTGWAFNVPVTYSYSSDIKLRSMTQRGRF